MHAASTARTLTRTLSPGRQASSVMHHDDQEQLSTAQQEHYVYILYKYPPSNETNLQ
jgi:hypothetical protein